MSGVAAAPEDERHAYRLGFEAARAALRSLRTFVLGPRLERAFWSGVRAALWSMVERPPVS